MKQGDKRFAALLLLSPFSFLLSSFSNNECFCSAVGTSDVFSDALRDRIHQCITDPAIYGNHLFILIGFFTPVGTHAVNLVSRLCFVNFVVCLRRWNPLPSITRGTKHLLSHFVIRCRNFVTTTVTRKMNHEIIRLPIWFAHMIPQRRGKSSGNLIRIAENAAAARNVFVHLPNQGFG